MKKKLILLITIIASISILGGCIISITEIPNNLKGGINGSVIDGLSKTAVSSAVVSLISGGSNPNGTALSTETTDSEGSYSFSELSPGTYTLVVSNASYCKVWTTIVVTAKSTTNDAAQQEPPIVIIPTADSDEKLRVVLSWNKVNSADTDLDLHFTYPDGTTNALIGGDPYSGDAYDNPEAGDLGRPHVFFGDRDGDGRGNTNTFVSGNDLPDTCYADTNEFEGETYGESSLSITTNSTNSADGVNMLHAWLDCDDLTGAGPETLSISYTNCLTNLDGEYKITVFAYDETNSTTSTVLGSSKAVCRMYYGSTYLAEYRSPDGDVGNFWKVCTIVTVNGVPGIPQSDIADIGETGDGFIISGHSSNFAPKRRDTFTYNGVVYSAIK